MASFGNVTSVVERPVGTSLQTAALAGAGALVVDDVSKLTWPAGGLRIGTESFVYSIDVAPDQTVDVIDRDEDDQGVDEVGTVTLTGALLNGYDIDEPVVQFQESVVTERLATVLLPDQAEELVLRVPRHLWDRLPSDIRERDAAPETVALENVDGEWVMTDVVSEDPSVDASFIDISTLPTSTSLAPAGTGADDATFFDEAWTAPGNVTGTADNAYAHAIGTSATATVTPHNTGFRLPTAATDDSATGSVEWLDPVGILALGGLAASAFGAGNTHRLQATDFGFSVPVGATITGVTARVTRRSANDRTGFDVIVKLIKGGSLVGTDNSSPAAWPITLTGANYGGDLWGTTLTPADVNASDFGVSIQATNTDTFDPLLVVDAIQVRVNYTTVSTTAFRSNTHFLKATNFTLGVPDDSTIIGVTVQIERHASDNTGDDYVADNQVRLTNGTDVSADAAKTGHWPTSDAIATYGGDLWGMELTSDDINNSAFGVLLSADVNFNVTAFVDAITISIAYVTSGDA